jgi:transposase
MFVQRTTSRRGKTIYTSFLVRESYRTPKGPRSRTVCNITGLPDAVRELVTSSLKGETCVSTEALTVGRSLDYGGLAVLVDAWNRYGLDAALAGIGTNRQRGLIKAMIFARLLFPSSKLNLVQQAEGTLLAQACGLPMDETFDEDELYEAMDAFSGEWVALEKALYKRAFPSEVQLVLYDLTSVYFEGKGPSGISRYGYSRDHRSDRPQVLLVVVTDREGIPLHLEVLRGNRPDNSTLQALLITLRRRFGIREATFVFDGGMSSRLNLGTMTTESLKFVTRLSSSTLTGLLKATGITLQMELGDQTRVMEVAHDGKRYIIAGGPWRQQRDQERRAARIAKGEAALTRLAGAKRRTVDAQKLASQAGRALERVKAHKYFTYQVTPEGKLSWARKEEVVDTEAVMDGWYLLHTNATKEELSPEETLKRYKGLLEVEDAFREVKTYLQVRPVYHYKPSRVRNHMRICFLAYWISARLGSEWRQCDQVREVPLVLRQLQSIRIGVLSLDGKPIRTCITQIPKPLNELLESIRALTLFSAPPAWAAV